MGKRTGPMIALSIVLLSVSAHATQVIYKSPTQLGAESALVVRGSVSSVRSFWNPQHTKIFTEVSVTVDESYKGAAPGVVRLLQLGGTVDGVKVTVHGALAWRPDEEVLLFLEPYSGDYHVSGFSQGKFHILRDAHTGKPYVSRPAISGAQLVSSADGKTAKNAAAAIERIPLAEFLDRALAPKGGSR